MITIELENFYLIDARIQLLSILDIYQDDGFGNGVLLDWGMLEMNNIYLNSDKEY